MPEMFGKRERDKSQRAHSGLKNRVSRQAPICQEGLRISLNGNKRKAHPSWHSEATMPHECAFLIPVSEKRRSRYEGKVE